MTEDELSSLAGRIRQDSKRLARFSKDEDRKGRTDLLAAAKLLERSLFHIERARSAPAVSEPIQAEVGEMLDIEIQEDLLEANKRIAQANRALLAEHGVVAIDVMGAIGSGKTSLIASIVEKLGKRTRCGMLGGDVATSIDADMVRQKGAVTVQINTGKECHLDANLVRRALERIDLSRMDVLFIENVGNLICPAEFDLGASRRMVVISVTEGEGMVVKHPMMFQDADVVAINKIDMAEIFGTNVRKLESDIASINSRAIAIRTSARTGQGLEDLVRALSLGPLA